MKRRAVLSAGMAAMVCAAQWLPAAGQQAPERHTLFVELRQPYDKTRPALQKMLKAEGHESSSEREGELSLALTAAQIEKLFGARVRHRTAEKSAAPGSVSVPYLEGARIPPRFEKLIRSVYFDPQRG